ncbi:MAG TPA: DUF4402 domain-containing protein [Candidatus Acidoferrales bacterium]|nr:DUF4402 domain-containing protein [Candidatus Acidoferrales bacterium]
MKKLMLVAALVLVFAGMSFAQDHASSTATINANIQKGLTISVSNAILDLGNLVAGTTPAAVSPLSGTVPAFTVTGDGGHVVNVSYDATVTLNGPSSATMTFNSDFKGDASGTQGSAGAVGATVTLSGASPATGNYYFWLGGNVGSIDPAQAPGSYTGTFHVSVNY